MKVIYYHRERTFSFHEMFYIPNENVVLFFQDQAGVRGGGHPCEYSFSDENNNKEYLEEAKIIGLGEIPKKEGTSFYRVKTIECEDSKIIDLIKSTKLKKELNVKVESGIEGLIEQVGVKMPWYHPLK